MDKILDIKNLSIGYHGRKHTVEVSSSLSARLQKGELVCLLGANGKGKSTLIKTICKFIPPLKGQISLQEKDISQIDELEMSKKVSVVLTERLNVPNATVDELVSYGRSPYTGFLGRLSKIDWEIVHRSMDQCNISHKSNHLLSSLSDGERQKASIAKALAQNTSIVILDEPTAFLDLPSRVEIMKLLRQLASNSGKAILMSTHDLDLALQMADKLWLMHKNKIEQGSPEDLVYNDAFQHFFEKESVAFDNETCSFKVAYNDKQKLAVNGTGFEYMLLKRAFARHGVELVNYDKTKTDWINITQNNKDIFQLYVNNKQITSGSSFEQIVIKYLQLQSSKF